MKIKFSYSNSPIRPQLCRLCGSYGHERIDIFDHVPSLENHISSPIPLSERIFRCVGIRVERNDRMAKKICQHCFDKVNKFGRLRDAYVAADMRISNVERGETTADMEAARCEAAADTKSEWSIVSSLEDVRLPHTTGTHEDTDSIGTKTHQQLEVQRDLLPGATQLLYSPTNVVPGHTTTTESAVSVFNSTDHLRYTHLSSNTNTSDCGEMSNDSPNNIELAQSVNSCYITNDAHQSNALNDSPVMCVLSPEEDGLKSDNTNTYATKKKELKKTAKRKAVKSVERLTMMCGLRRCREMFGTDKELMYHKETYHAGKFPKTISCYLCKGQFTVMKTLRRHFNNAHSPHIRFMCSVASCSKHYSLRKSLKQHENAVHTRKFVFKCTKCPQKSYYASNVRRHWRTNHMEGLVTVAGQDSKVNEFRNICYKRISSKHSSSQ